MNDEIRMPKLEAMTNQQMTKRWLSHSFVIRHWSFVICLLAISATSTLLAQKRPITEKDLWDFVWIGDSQISPDG